MPRRLLYVGDFLGATISVVDVDAGALDRTIEMGTVDVDGIAVPMQVDSFYASPDGRVMYASRFPLGGPLAEIQGAEPVSGDVIALDTATDEILWTIPIDGKPNHISLSKDGSRVFVPIRDKLHVEVYDVASQALVGKINCGWGPHGTKLSADGRHLYVGNIFQHTLAVLDVEEMRLAKAIPLGEAVRPFAVTADETVAYVQLSRLHGFVVVDLEAERKAMTVHLPELPLGTPVENTYGYTVNHGMALRKAEHELWVAGTAGGYVCVYELPSLKLAKTIEVGREPAYVAMDAREQLCFVSNRMEDTVSILDVESRTEVARVAVGRYPSRIRLVEV